MEPMDIRIFCFLVLLSTASAQDWSQASEDAPIDTVEVEKKPGGRLNTFSNADMDKRGGARSFSSYQPPGDADESFREKRPGGRFIAAPAKRPGARFIAPSGGLGGGGGMAKRPGGRYFYGENRSKRPGGRYFGYQGDMPKRLGGRYAFGGGAGANGGRWKRAGGRHIGNSYSSFYGANGGTARRSYRTNWGR